MVHNTDRERWAVLLLMWGSWVPAVIAIVYLPCQRLRGGRKYVGRASAVPESCSIYWKLAVLLGV